VPRSHRSRGPTVADPSSIASTGYGTIRIRRTPQRGQELSLQRAGGWRRPRGALRLCHDGSQHRCRQGARSSSRPARRHECQQERRPCCGAVHRHRRSRRGSEPGRGPGQRVPLSHSRGRCDRVRPPCVSRSRRPRTVRSARAPSRRRDRTGARGSRECREGPRQVQPHAHGRQLARVRGRSVADLCRPPVGGDTSLQSESARRRPGGAQGVLFPHQQAGDGGTQHRRRPDRSRGRDRGAGARRARRCGGRAAQRAARSRGGADGRRRARGDARSTRARRGSGATIPHLRLPHARTPDLPHHGGQGESSVDLPCRFDRAGMRRRDPHRLPARLHPGRDDPVGRTARRRIVVRRPRRRQGGSWSAARDVGKVRSEGKDYIAQDGDVMEFRFNV